MLPKWFSQLRPEIVGRSRRLSVSRSVIGRRKSSRRMLGKRLLQLRWPLAYLLDGSRTLYSSLPPLFGTVSAAPRWDF